MRESEPPDVTYAAGAPNLLQFVETKVTGLKYLIPVYLAINHRMNLAESYLHWI